MRTRSTMFGCLVAGLLVASFATGVGAQSASPEASGMTGGLANTDWLLATVGDAPVASGINADLLFTDTDASGFDVASERLGGHIAFHNVGRSRQ